MYTAVEANVLGMIDDYSVALGINPFPVKAPQTWQHGQRKGSVTLIIRPIDSAHRAAAYKTGQNPGGEKKAE